MTNTPVRLIRHRAAKGAPRLVLAALALCTLGATAQPQAGEGPPSQLGGPPPEALAPPAAQQPPECNAPTATAS